VREYTRPDQCPDHHLQQNFQKEPSLAFFPKIDAEDNINNRTFAGIPGMKAKNEKVLLKISYQLYINQKCLLFQK
jgi:hypothetical protein